MTVINIKDSQSNSFTVTMEPTDTILNIKEKLSDQYGFDVSKINICYGGKILKNDQQTQQFGWDSNSSIRIHVLKKNVTVQKQNSPSINKPPPQNEEKPAPKIESPLPSFLPPQPAPSQPSYSQFSNPVTSTPNAFSNSQYEEVKNALIQYGYPLESSNMLAELYLNSGLKNVTTQTFIEAITTKFPPSIATVQETQAFVKSFSTLMNAFLNPYAYLSSMYANHAGSKNYNSIPYGMVTPESARNALRGLNTKQRIEVNTLFCQSRETFERVVITYVRNDCSMEKTKLALHPI